MSVYCVNCAAEDIVKERIAELEDEVDKMRQLLTKIYDFVYGGNHRPPITAEEFRPLMSEIKEKLHGKGDRQ